MLQRGLTQLSLSSLSLAPHLASCSSSICSQLTSSSPAGAGSSSSGGAALSTSAAPSSSSSAAVHAEATTSASSSSTSTSTSSKAGFTAVPVPSPFKAGAVSLQQLPGRRHKPYFNPEDGPEAYQYWEDLWRRESKLRKRQIPQRVPVYLEVDEQEALCEAAMAAGVPQQVVYGDMDKHELPRLIHFVYRHQPRFDGPPDGGIPSTPDALAERIQGLRELENRLPGLDVARIFKTHGFSVLASPPERIQQRIERLGRCLREAGVKAEPGLVFSAEPRLSMWAPDEVAKRAQLLPQTFKKAVGKRRRDLLSHPVHALLLGQGNGTVRRNLHLLKKRHGKESASELVTQLPHLAKCSPRGLDLKLAVLADGLVDPQGTHTPLDIAKALVRTEPRLLTHSTEVLQQRKQGLAQLLGLEGGQELSQVLRRQPSVLHKRTETLEAKLEALGQKLGLPDAAAAAALARRCPRLICMRPERMAAPLQCLRDIPDDSLLAPAKAQAVALCLQEPHLMQLRVSPGPTRRTQDSLASRLQLLQDLAATSPAWQARVSQLLEGEGMEGLAAVLATNRPWRLRAVLDRQQQGQGQGRGQDEAPELLSLLRMPAEEFGALYPSPDAGATSEGDAQQSRPE